MWLQLCWHVLQQMLVKFLEIFFINWNLYIVVDGTASNLLWKWEQYTVEYIF